MSAPRFSRLLDSDLRILFFQPFVAFVYPYHHAFRYLAYHPCGSKKQKVANPPWHMPVQVQNELVLGAKHLHLGSVPLAFATVEVFATIFILGLGQLLLGVPSMVKEIVEQSLSYIE